MPKSPHGPGEVRFLEPDAALERWPPLYERLRDSRPGMMDALPPLPLERLSSSPAPTSPRAASRSRQYVEYSRSRTDPRATPSTRSRADWPEGPSPRASVRLSPSWSPLNTEAEAALWRYLFGIDLIETIQDQQPARPTLPSSGCWPTPATSAASPATRPLGAHPRRAEVPSKAAPTPPMAASSSRSPTRSDPGPPAASSWSWRMGSAACRPAEAAPDRHPWRRCPRGRLPRRHVAPIGARPRRAESQGAPEVPAHRGRPPSAGTPPPGAPTSSSAELAPLRLPARHRSRAMADFGPPPLPARRATEKSRGRPRPVHPAPWRHPEPDRPGRTVACSSTSPMGVALHGGVRR